MFFSVVPLGHAIVLEHPGYPSPSGLFFTVLVIAYLGIQFYVYLP